MYYSEFIRSAESRRYFWARNYRGWPRFAAAEPNAAHFALAELENRGAVATLITQNVDDLHHRAGQQEIVELHGQSNRVRCLQCHGVVSRLAFQERLSALNESWTASATVFHPDADAEIERQATTSFQVAACEQCDGIMKPDVVFFGESVPREVVERCMEEVIASDLLLVAGSSLAVWSGFRFVKAAHELGKRIVIINAGTTRADELATLKIEADCGDVLSRVAELGG
jgi:NAD-dependent SIR2 family protein deacetylase